MWPKVKPELIQTELSAIAFCFFSGVVLLSVAALTRDKFNVPGEWYGFTAGVFTWINLVILRLFRLHESRTPATLGEPPVTTREPASETPRENYEGRAGQCPKDAVE